MLTGSSGIFAGKRPCESLMFRSKFLFIRLLTTTIAMRRAFRPLGSLGRIICLHRRESEIIWSCICSEEDLNSPYLAPLIADDLSNQPKTLIITAEYDPLRDEGEAYGRKLSEYGNSVDVYRLKDCTPWIFLITEAFCSCEEKL